MSEGQGEGPVLPPKPKRKMRGVSIYLDDGLWEKLDQIAKASGEYTRNEVVTVFLRNRVEAWEKEQGERKPGKK